MISNDSQNQTPIELIVSTLEDENDGDFNEGDISLREAISIAELDSTITFNSNLNGGTINLSLGELVIDKNITIQGLGANNLTIDADGKSRVFNVDDGNADTQIDVEINDLTVTGGSSPSQSSNGDSGGGIFNSENLIINNASIRDNRNVARGAGIYSEGTLTTNNSAIYNNSADGNGVSGEGGGIANFGGAATINQSTISNNSASVRSSGQLTGGGIFNQGSLEVTNSTISGNLSGIANSSYGDEDTVVETTLNSTIVAGNTDNDDLQRGEFISGGNNLIGGEILGFVNGGEFINNEPSDLIGTEENIIDPLLGELQDNGGATPTQALLSGSPALDTGSNPNNLATDQRGEGFNRTVGNSTDIGAFEVQASNNGGVSENLVVSILEDENDGNFSNGDLSLREAIAISNEREGADTISFDSTLNGSIVLSEGELVVTDSLTIDGLGTENITIDGNNNSRIFKIDDGNTENIIDVNLQELSIINGNATNDSTTESNSVEGGAILNRENLSLDKIVASDNSAQFGGGVYSSGTVNITSSRVSGNSASQGGGVYNYRGELSVTDSTFSNNESVFRGGGISNFSGNFEVTNSTISGNSAELGGGISNYTQYDTSTTSITNSTITGNSASNQGGGLYNGVNGATYDSDDGDSSIIVTSSIVAENNNQDVGGNSAFVSEGNNLIGNGDGATGFENSFNGDIVGSTDELINPRLGELQNNGGSTETISLLEDSPAIDSGSNPNNLATDQRGEGFNRTVGNGTDIGAVEVQAIVTPVSPGVPEGRDGDDRLFGDAGDDEILGGNGNDFIVGNDGNDHLFGGNGRDTLIGGRGNDTLRGENGNDVLLGGEGDESIRGGEGNDFIKSNSGSDVLHGDAGNDTLIGGQGDDTLTGGQGHDVFVLDFSGGQDIIIDFVDGSDRLQFSGTIKFEDLHIANRESGSGVSIFDTSNDNLLVADIDNIHAQDISSHDFI